MKRVAIYGGTFNPMHFGHIGMALWTLTHTDLDELWLMVTPGNPLKDGQLLAQNEQERLLAARNTIQQVVIDHADELRNKHLRVSDFEFSLPKPSFTAQTLQALQQTYPDIRWSLLIGQDNYDIFTRWRNWQWIARNFSVFVYPRLPEGTQHADCAAPPAECFKDLVFLHSAPLFDISSTRIRTKNNPNLSFPLA